MEDALLASPVAISLERDLVLGRLETVGGAWETVGNFLGCGLIVLSCASCCLLSAFLPWTEESVRFAVFEAVGFTEVFAEVFTAALF